MGPVRESNPGPRAPEARIIPLDQQAIAVEAKTKGADLWEQDDETDYVEPARAIRNPIL